MTDLTARMIRAAKLDRHLYEEVEADEAALKPAMLVVVLSSLAAGIGATLHAGVGGLLLGIAAALLGWYLWAYLVYLIGTKLLPEHRTHADLGQLLRTTGFSSAPGVIRVLGVVPGATTLIFAIASIWMFVAMVVAVRQALDYQSTLRAVGVCVLGWLVQLLIVFVVLAMTGRPA